MNNLVISARERFLDRLLGVDPTAVLNPPQSTDEEYKGSSSLDKEIKQSLNQIKAEAFRSDGQKVDYAVLPGSPSYQEYRALVSNLNQFDIHSLSSREQVLGFWINLYNALVIDAVIHENIQKSVIESRFGILGFFQKAAYQVGDERFSLTDIEHGVLRANSGTPYLPGPHFSDKDPRMAVVIKDLDPRIHFALNCASLSCPPIGVYSPDHIDEQLDLATRNFINTDTLLDINRQQITVSRIFRWYRDDFGGNQGILKFLMEYLETPMGLRQNQIDLSNFRVKFHRYDWRLNKLI
jgi:hypothetical protein